VCDVLTSVHWHPFLSRPWLYHSSHINTLELNAVLFSLHLLLRSPAFHHTRLLLLLDSSVSLYGLLRGRSSRPALVSVLRRIASLLLLSGCTLHPMWIPTHINPADLPSRQLLSLPQGRGTHHVHLLTHHYV
jgi:hypothetical protein